MNVRAAHCAAVLLGVCGAACVHAQSITYEEGGAQLRFQVWDGSAWGSSVNAQPGQQVEWRVVVDYTGTRSDLFVLNEVLYQPTIANADNVGAGAQADQIGPWRNGGNGGLAIAGSMLTTAEGESGGPLRMVSISTFPASFRRAGGTTSTDDRRYGTWMTGAADSGSHRTGVSVSPAFVFVTGSACDSIDFNRDTLFPDVQDIADFVQVFAGGACPTGSCGDIDFNNDTLFPDIADIESLVSVFAGGPCD